MLCTASVAAMKTPVCAPLLPQNATPIPNPSAKECIAMTKMTMNIFLAWRPSMSPMRKSWKSASTLLVERTKSIPNKNPRHTRRKCEMLTPCTMTCIPSSSSAMPSAMRE